MGIFLHTYMKIILVCLSLAVFLSGCGLKTKTKISVQKSEIIGGIVPHHDLVNKEIERFWNQIKSTSSVDTLIIIGPDHRQLAREKIVTTLRATSFQNGTALNTSFINSLIKSGAVKEDDDIFINEYSIQIHIPFIRQFLPQAAIIPILIGEDATTEDTKKLSEEILLLSLQNKIGIVGSIDFSHYKKFLDAEKFDQESIIAIQKSNIEAINSFGSEHVDSRNTLIAVIMTLCPASNCTWDILYHGNSSQYAPFNPNYTTSYYSLLIKK